MAIGAIVQGAGQVAGLVGSFIGGRKRRREQRLAKAEMGKYKAKYEQLDTSNPYANITNPYENLTVNTQAADFAAQQSSQNAANIMSSMSAAAGGGGIAALAQSMANAQNQQAQQASASIAQQESQNQQLAASGEFKRQSMIAAGEQVSQQREAQKTATLLGMSQQRLGAANAARAQATQNTLNAIQNVTPEGVEGMGKIAGGIGKAGGAIGGLFKSLGV